MNGQYSAFADVAIFEAVRTPWIDLGGALSQASPIDLGIKVGREVLARAGIEPQAVDSVLAGSMAQSSFDAYLLPRHIGLYSGVAQAVPALGVQRICATGFELLRQAAGQLRDGAQLALCVWPVNPCRATPSRLTPTGAGFVLAAKCSSRIFCGKPCTTRPRVWT